jgi:hypothetical protein
VNGPAGPLAALLLIKVAGVILALATLVARCIP